MLRSNEKETLIIPSLYMWLKLRIQNISGRIYLGK